MNNQELELIKGRERMSIVCNIARKRISSAKMSLGIPEVIACDEYVISKGPENIALVTETVNDINKLLNLELINAGVIVATDDIVREDVDDVRARLAEIVQILGKGRPVPHTKTIEDNSNSYPISVGLTTITTVVLATLLILIAIDSKS